MKGVLTGTLTFLLTDIEGSTRLWETEPEQMSVALARHDELVADSIAAHGGIQHKQHGEGDSTFSIFDRADQALAAALDIQRAVAAEPWPADAPLRLRVALHSGVAELRGGDYFGATVNRCARLRAVANGGQTVLSNVTAELAREELPEDAALIDLGFVRLRDLARPERIFVLAHPDVPGVIAPLRGLDTYRHNLPVQSSPLIGRDVELRRARELLGRSDARLITFTGAGGIGKTRLALQIAADATDEFPGGVWLVSLQSVEDPALLVPAIARSLDLREDGEDLEHRVRNRLGTERTLLVLDNFEQLIAAANVVAELLANVPELRVFVTSREPLHLRGEHEFPVPPLSCPQRDRVPLLEALSQYDAVAMFIDRALSVRPGFRITNENAAAVAQICARLDGLPLAIELAAARIKLLSPQALLDRLEGSLNILDESTRDLPERHRTLRAAIGWSYELLDDSERTLLQRLSVFAGGCTLDAAEAVCGADADVLDGIASLLDKSLLRQDEHGDGEPRFAMLVLVREFATRRLVETGDLDAMRRAHLDWCRSFAESVRPELDGREQRRWFERIDVELDNIRAALAYGVDHAPEEALRLARAMIVVWDLRGGIAEGRQWLGRLLLDETVETSLRIDAILGTDLDPGAAQLAQATDDQRGSDGLLELARRLAEQSGDRARTASALDAIGMALRWQSRFAEALASHEAALEIRRELDDTHATAVTMMQLGQVAQMTGDESRARDLLDDALRVFRALGDTKRIPYVLRDLSYHADEDEAQGLLQEALDIRRAAGGRETGGTLADLALRARYRGDHAAADAYMHEALALRRALGDRRMEAWTLLKIAEFAFERGDYDDALEWLDACSAVDAERGEGESPWVHSIRGDIALARGHYLDAREHYLAWVDVAERNGSLDFAGWGHTALGIASLLNNDFGTAQSRFEKGLALRAEAGRPATLAGLAATAHERGDYDEACDLYRRTIELSVDEPFRCVRTADLAMSEARAGRLDRASEIAADAIARSDATRSARIQADCRRVAAAVAIERGELGDAERFLADGLARVRAIPERARLERFLRQFAALRVAQGRWIDALRILGAAAAARALMGAVVQPVFAARHEATIAAARARLTPEAADAAWSAGESLTLQDAIAEALGEREAPPVEATAQRLGDHVFRTEGDVWVVEFGGAVARVRDTRGMRYLRELLRNPGQEIHVLELAALAAGGKQVTADAPVELLDEQARRAYRERLADLEETVREATEWGDDERAARAQAETDALLAELSRAVGLGGRSRTGSAAERARSTVTKAIKTAIARVKTAHPGLGKHLDTTLRTGLFCSYSPDPRVPIRWET